MTVNSVFTYNSQYTAKTKNSTTSKEQTTPKTTFEDVFTKSTQAQVAATSTAYTSVKDETPKPYVISEAKEPHQRIRITNNTMLDSGAPHLFPDLTPAMIAREKELMEAQAKAAYEQLQTEPKFLDELIYELLPQEEADEILAFLDGKNKTAFQYHYLLEKYPDRAAVYIDSMMNLGGYSSIDGYWDEKANNMSYKDFMKGVNNAMVNRFELNHPDADMWSYWFIEERTIFDLTAGNLAWLTEGYGHYYNGKRGEPGREEYLSIHTNQWLNLDKWQKELEELGKPQNQYTERCVYQSGLDSTAKPVGYGNKNEFIIRLGYFENANLNGFKVSQDILDLYKSFV